MPGVLRTNPRNKSRTERELIHVLRRYRPIGCYRLDDPDFTPPPSPCVYPHKVVMPSLGPGGYAIQIGREPRNSKNRPCPILTTGGDCTLLINHAGPHSDGSWTGTDKRPAGKRGSSDMGRPADPRYYSTDDFYPVMTEAARELAWLWRRSRESAATIAKRTGVPQELVAEAMDYPRDTANRLIYHFREVQTSRKTLNRHLRSFRECHPSAGIGFRDPRPGRPSPFPTEFHATTIVEVKAYLSATIDTFLSICPPKD